jgi:hypothetical protein
VDHQQDATVQTGQDAHHTQEGLTATAPSQFQYRAQFSVNGQTYSYQEMLQAQQKACATQNAAQAANEQAGDDDFASPFTNEYIAQRSAAGTIPTNVTEMNQAHAGNDHQALLGGGSDFNFNEMEFSDMNVEFDDSDKFFAEMNQMISQDSMNASLANQVQHGQHHSSGQHQPGNFVGNTFTHQQLDSHGNVIGSAYTPQQFDMAAVPGMQQQQQQQQQQYGHQGNAFIQQPMMYQGNTLPNHVMQKQLDEQGNVVGITFYPQPGQQAQQQANKMLPHTSQQQQHRGTLPPPPMQSVPSPAPAQQQPRLNGRLKAVRSKPRAQKQQAATATANQRQRSHQQILQGTMQQGPQGQMANNSIPAQVPMNMAQHHSPQPLPSQPHPVPTHNLQMSQPATGVPLMNQQMMQPAPADLMVQQQMMHPACATNPPMARTASNKPKIQRMMASSGN